MKDSQPTSNKGCFHYTVIHLNHETTLDLISFLKKEKAAYKAIQSFASTKQGCVFQPCLQFFPAATKDSPAAQKHFPHRPQL